MHIKSIIIDGFKSYAKRTEICGFDPAFNAITGLNGSGKSNILDSICFLLGITNLSQVRASNLQDLVYKSGQAGVTKATVSIIFENKDKTTSPQGYENFDELTITRQIVIGGKNKYLINGITATNTRVQDLFRSVQLNVNNPHFLIMQGRITKVLNMKPPEILSLLEEAASTKHYELKREDTLKTIEKKDGKLHEIDKILKEDIKPKLAKLKQERSSYLEYQKIVRDLEYLNKFVVAYDYSNKKAFVENSEGELNKLITQQSQEERTIIHSDESKSQSEKKICEISENRDKVELVKLDELQTSYLDLQKQEAILKNGVKRAEENLKEANKNVKSLEQHSKEDKESYGKVRLEIEKIQCQYDVLREQVEKSKLDLDAAQLRLQEVNFGFFVSESGDARGSLGELLARAEKEESTLQIQLNVSRMKVTHFSKIVSELEQKLRGMTKNDSAVQQEVKHRQLKDKIAAIEKRIRDTEFSPELWDKLQVDRSSMVSEFRKCRDSRDQWIRSNRRFEFEYTKPYKDFDESKIFGMVATLVQVEQAECSLALEIATGNRLFNIVVEKAAIVVELLEGNCLRNRTTLLPLDTMNFTPISINTFKQAQNILGSDNVWYPLHVISFDQKYKAAMQFVFGDFLIARDLNMAKIVAFDSRIKCRCVTLDGEIFDPEGTLMGGSRRVYSKIFENAQYFVQLNQSLGKLTLDQKNIDHQLAKMNETREQFYSLGSNLSRFQVELLQVERQMREDDYLDVQKKLIDAKDELKTNLDDVNSKEKEYKIACTKTKEAQENVANSATVQERARQTAQGNVKKAQDELIKNEEAFKNIEFNYDSLTLELNSYESDQKRVQSDIDAAVMEVESKTTELQHENNALVNHSEVMKSAKVQFDVQKKIVQEIEIKIGQLRDNIKEFCKNKDQAILKLSDVNHRISCHKRDREEADKKLEKLIDKFLWIKDEEKYFNKAGGIYDFAARDLKEIEQNIEKLQEQKRKLGSKVNLRGMNMLSQTEERYNDLMTKYHKVLQDKKILQSVIEELDALKDQVIKKAHQQVDQDFNKIFSTLLPNSQARLIPPEGKTLSDGLEFKIAFGNVWKDSLNELSGGQRSLVALSLILALLRFKPAPLYILDEVDAALDISHTSNIGTIIKEQFNNSQFIIVSLKDGMFSNANVLFKTKFVDGVSTVSRHVNTARRAMAEKNS